MGYACERRLLDDKIWKMWISMKGSLNEFVTPTIPDLEIWLALTKHPAVQRKLAKAYKDESEEGAANDEQGDE